MSEKSAIEWTDATWNATLGCSKVSPGCKHCCAINHVHRMAGNPNPKIRAANEGLTVIEGGHPNWNGKIRLIPERLEIPLRTRKPTRYFVNALSDLFHESLPDEAIDQVFAVMALCPQHTFQVLTKRAERMREYFADPERPVKLDVALLEAVALPYNSFGGRKCFVQRGGVEGWPLPNVWLGVSVEDRANLKRINYLRQTPAAVRFLSLEPLLEDLGDLSRYLSPHDRDVCGCESDADWCPYRGAGIDWVIVGGESGPGARPCDLAWIRSIVAQCKAAGVPVFVKQLGAKPWVKTAHHYGPGVDAHPYNMRYQLKDRKGGDMEEWPQDLRVRQMPGATTPAVASAVSATVGQGESDSQTKGVESVHEQTPNRGAEVAPGPDTSHGGPHAV